MRQEDILPDFDPLCVLACSSVQPSESQPSSDDPRSEVPVFGMEEVKATTEHESLMVALDAEALTCVRTSKPTLQIADDVVVDGGRDQTVHSA